MRSVKRPTNTRANYEYELKELRSMVNEIDEAIIEDIANRLLVARTIGTLKKIHNQPVKDQKREKELNKLHEMYCKKYKISLSTIKKIFTLIIEESKRLQKA